MPKEQLNERSALCLLALLDLTPEKSWKEAAQPLIGVTPIMDWARKHYRKKYAPNTRETIRRQTLHQFVQAGIALYNPDDPGRAVNSPKAVYQIAPDVLTVLRSFGASSYASKLAAWLGERQTLAARYAGPRNLETIPLRMKSGAVLKLSPGAHSRLIREIVEEFGPRFAPDGEVLYIGDTAAKFRHCDIERFQTLGVKIDNHGKMPDVAVYDPRRNWLLLIESVTSHGPVNAKRRQELSDLFRKCTAGLVFVSAFPDHKVFVKYLADIAWETEVWIASAPEHLVHFNGIRFLGPYER